MPDEYIDKAAIRHGSVVYTGSRHPEISYDMVRAIGCRPKGIEKGFVTGTGRFVTRKEAADIAYFAGQTYGIRYDYLYSEDVW